MSHRSLLWITASCACLLAACTHTMTVRNLKEFSLQATRTSRQNVAVMCYDDALEGGVFFDHVADALRAHPSVGEFHSCWSPRVKESQFEADVVLRIRPRVKYRGSAWNLPISFPGFLVFAHAWNGFVYTGDVVTEVEILDPATLETVDTIEFPTKYSMRHTSFQRGFWAGSGWWLPGYGATALLSGLIYVLYDDNATEPFHETVERPYGEYIAENALRRAFALSRSGDAQPLAESGEVSSTGMSFR